MPNKDNALEDLIWAIEASTGEFSLILAHCNYAELRRRMVDQLQEKCPVRIRKVTLPRRPESLYQTVLAETEKETPEALMVQGLESSLCIDEMLKTANQVREAFSKNFPFPLVLWVNDAVLKKLIRVAPDLRSWAGSAIHFELSDDELLKQTSEVFKTSEVFLELEFFLKDLEDRHLDSTPEQKADFQFLKAKHLQNKGETEEAIAYYEQSLAFWKECGRRERQAVLLLATARCYEEKGDLEKADSYFKDCIEAFGQENDLAGRYACERCRVLKRLGKWEELRQTAEEALKLNKTCDNPVGCAECRIFLAEAALHDRKWKEAISFARDALNTPSSADRDQARLILARAHRELNQPDKAIEYLQKAIREGQYESAPKLYVGILDFLHQVYFAEKQYLEAFETKQAKYSLEQQFGFRAFIGAGRLKAQRGALSRETSVAQEIRASGRQKDVDELTKMLRRKDYKLILFHGQSGVGKSSVLEAGLKPALEEAGDVRPVLIRSYVNWREELGQNLSDEVCDSTGRIFDELRNYDKREILCVLIFDQFEEFFFANPSLGKRREFYEFLGKCLDIPSVKVILSLREDYLHYLLEIERVVTLAIDHADNILTKELRISLGNFTPEEAGSLIRHLTERSQFRPEDELIERIVQDLAGTADHRVRPIELQIVGSRMEAKTIDTLEKYRPKEELVEEFLEEAVTDCGTENKDAANLILYLLTSERFIRPLKTRAEILRELRDSGLESMTDGQLGLILNILEGAGLIIVVPGEPERYQLVHDYLAEFVRGRGQGSNLLAELNAEKKKVKAEQEKRKKAEQENRQLLEEKLREQQEYTRKLEEQRQKAEINATEAMSQSAYALFLSGGKDLEVLIAGVKAGKNAGQVNLPLKLKNQITDNFREIIHGVREKNRIYGHTDSVYSVNFSPDGKTLASGSWDKNVKL